VWKPGIIRCQGVERASTRDGRAVMRWTSHTWNRLEIQWSLDYMGSNPIPGAI
jgi:hypothetical protein